MKIVVNNIAASTSGALSILHSFYDYIRLESDKEIEWIFLLNDNYIEETKNIKVIILKDVKKTWIRRLTFDCFTGKKLVSKLKPDIVFSLQNTIFFGVDCPQVLYVHQSIPFQDEKKFSFLKPEERILAVYQHIIGRMIIKSIKKADKIIVQTIWMRERIIRKTNINPRKILSFMPPQVNKAESKFGLSYSNTTFFYPAQEILYKNHECIYKANNELKQKGIREHEIILTIDQEKTEKNISFIGKIEQKDVMEYYSRTTLVFPSYIETVGLPLIEAREIGSIILAADCPYAREVLGNYENAYFFNPFSPKELAILMEKVLNSEIKKIEVEKKVEKTINSWQEVIKVIKQEIGEV
ncbi:glycosyltransferase [Planococcus sp. SE5232]|uniref:glycosyltransferase n=1 Tax=unclassified Planococcus (in: firmicutes) TaxID=2662419 RepID=UPI003D6B55BC